MSERYPAIPVPAQSLVSLNRTAQSLKEMVETIVGLRGTGILRAWTLGEVNKARTVPMPVAAYNISALPLASDYRQCVVLLLDGAGNKLLAVSDGVVWRYADGSAV